MSVGTIIERLLKHGRITAQKRKSTTSGRPALEYRYNAEYAQVLALYTCTREGKDILYLCVADLVGTQIITEHVVLNDITRDTFIPHIKKMLNRFPSICAIAFGLPGTICNGVLEWIDYPALRGEKLAEYYEKTFGMPVIVENDVNAAVRGYCTLRGLTQTCVGYVYFPEKYAPGVGIWLNGTVYRGAHGFAGEIGALPLGIAWETLDYSVFDLATNAVARMASVINGVLDLDTLVLCGEFLHDSHLQEIQKQSNQYVLSNAPDITLSQNFLADYSAGIIACALQQLRPSIRFTKETV